MVPSVVEPQVNCTRCGLPLAADRPFCDHCGAPNLNCPPPNPDDELQEFAPVRVGDELEGKWRLERRLGTGGMGTVYLAHDLQLDRKVAVKVLATAFAGDAEVVARFEREARITASLEHSNIVPIYSVGRVENRPFIVMKYLPGRTLAAYIREKGRLGRDELMPILRQLCAGLDFIHSRFFIHRDIKAGNIFLSPGGHVTILDFGILRSAKNPDALTRTGMLVGTPQYMSPEQARGDREIDHRSDIYALAVLLFECLTGTLPFDANSELSIIQMQAHSAPPDLLERAPWVPPQVAEVVKRALEKRPEDRFSSAGELLIHFERAYFEAEGEQPLGSSPLIAPGPVPNAPSFPSAERPPVTPPPWPPSLAFTRPSMRKQSEGESSNGAGVWSGPGTPVPSGVPRTPSGVPAVPSTPSSIPVSASQLPAPGPVTADLVRKVKSRHGPIWIWLVGLPAIGAMAYFAVRTFGFGSEEKAPTVLLERPEPAALAIGPRMVAVSDGGEANAGGRDGGDALAESFGLRLDLEGFDGGTAAPPQRPSVEVASTEPVVTREKRTRPTKKVAWVPPGQLNIVTTYKGDTHWAGVSIDGVQRGTTPLLLELPAGKHKVRVERTGFKPVEREIKIARGRPLVLRIELAP